RPSAKELLKHRFIRNARKSPRLLDRIKERPKYQVKDDTDNVRNNLKAYGEGSDTVKVTREQRTEETVKSSNQGKTFRNQGWDFSIGGSQSTGTVRSAVRPPPVRAKREDTSNNVGTQRKNSDGDSQWHVSSGNGLYESSEVSLGRYSRDQEEDSLSGSGTIVVRSPRGQSSSHSDQSTQSNSTYASFEDTSTTSGTLIVRAQRDEPDSPRSPKSRLRFEETSSSSNEDSATNLAEATAAMQKGLRKGSARERPVLNRVSKDMRYNKSDQMPNSSESPRRSRDYLDAQKAFSRSPKSDDEENSRTSIVSSSTSLSALLIPSLKEVTVEDSGGAVRAIINALNDIERRKPGSSEVLVSRLLHRLGSSRDPSLKDLQELAVHIFSRSDKAAEQSNLTSDADSKKKHQSKELLSNPNISPLARFLLARSVPIL
ncbi:hypothetical protein KSS87_002231, partial [Heliosperma pusillum]